MFQHTLLKASRMAFQKVPRLLVLVSRTVPSPTGDMYARLQVRQMRRPPVRPQGWAAGFVL